MTNALRRSAVIAVVTLATSAPLGYAAKPVSPSLAGVYKDVASQACQTNLTGFTAYPDLFALDQSFQGSIDNWESTMEFFSNGTVTETSHGQYLLPGVLNQPAGDFDNTCNYIATTNADGSLTLNGSCNGKTLSGIGKGEDTTLAPAAWRVFPVQGMILLSSSQLQVTTLTSSKNGTFKRICQGHGVGVKF